MNKVYAGLVFYYFYINFIVRNVGVVAKIEYSTYPYIHSRATVYSPTVISKTCLLKPDPGPCRGNISMYHYNPKLKTCTQFHWGGCQGNGNRFDGRAECLDSCLSQPNPANRRPKWCSLTFDYGFCFGAVDRWYYDRLWKVCKKTIYSGCGGNKNNFYNMEQCESVCSFGLGPIAEFSKLPDGMKKILIVNPWDATTKKRRDQVPAGSPPVTSNITAPA